MSVSKQYFVLGVRAAACFTGLMLASISQAGIVTTDGPDLMVKTRGGLELATVDKTFSFKLGGRVQADYSQFDGIYTNNGINADAAYLRRAYLEFGGRLYSDWKYQVNYDLSRNAGNASSGYFDQASLTYTGFDLLDLRLGRFYTDFGLEKATSSKWVTAMERNLSYDAVSWTGDNLGLGIQARSVVNNLAFVSASLFNENNNDSNGDSVKRYNLRTVFAPWNSTGNVLHLGAQFAYRDLQDSTVDTRIRSRLGIRGVDTEGGNDAGTNGNRPLFGGASAQPGLWRNDSVWGLEGAWAHGPLSLQAEYLRRTLKADKAASDVNASGYYGQVAYTLTGEARQYRLDGAAFDAIKPENQTIGAWELFYRYDSLTVEDNNLAREGSAKGQTHTLGVNWYANEAVKVSANYVSARTDNLANQVGDDSGSGVAMRLQYAF
ncbi:porin [Pseudomonas sp. TNT2022 ID1025]|uniref:Porin n=2 Tax=Pseudomonas rubra TaxID=2942627 RepID=A0ABT5PFE7_9PSED|nr:porin [Pseudomonas rubra]MDD1040989.1 porin [Pseudomonas rubra]MDD1153545.1 porin [Pseudomonas rubra]